ncbi:hypothetical protein IW261DRAFT_1415483 [Armillaria novae-zelandiae]|uniref:DUF6533 domain-containing protein n=1 Tax=Armillaria novae-zelandiae TaxID=153914 RepID=A0AA39ULH5_9AGAR|nr:hypothetical protein IW261DRAFT_1415483 [Armillaria novae-zelandiae]
MSTISIPVDRILFVTYTPVSRSAAAMVLMLWDHCLAFGEEVATIWGPLDERILTTVVHILNRYFTEAILIYRVYVTIELAKVTDSKHDCKAVVWLANISAVIIASISQFIADCATEVYIMMRVYRIWDHRHYLKSGGKSDSQSGCAIGRVPRTVVCTIGVLLLFNVFVIFMTVYNALEKPRRSENELLDSLRCDGARIYLYASTTLLFGINLTTTCSVVVDTSGVFCQDGDSTAQRREKKGVVVSKPTGAQVLI